MASFFATFLFAAASVTSGVSKSGYLDVMEAAVNAYSDNRLVSYCEEAARDGVQEHGFPRLAANLSVLVANGRLSGRRELVKKMMDVCCRDGAASVVLCQTRMLR